MERFTLTEAGIGSVFGLEMLALAFASVWFAWKGAGLNFRRFSLFGLMIIVTGYVIALVSMQLWQFALARFIIGLGEGLVLGAATAIGLAGPVLAILMHVRFGRILPFSIGLLVLACSILGITHASSAYTYIVCLLPLNLTILFLNPYFLGALAEIDKTGAWTTLSAPVVSFGLAVGPVITGVLAAEAGYETVGWFAGAITLGALGLMLVVLNREVFKNAKR